MSLYIKPPKGQVQTVAICDRCHMKALYTDLIPDGNNPGLYVHRSDFCRDQLDPYKKPPRVSELISVRHPRRDEDVST